MKTVSIEKIQKAEKLLSIIESRKILEKEEASLKDYFKSEIKDGVLIAGNVTITIEEKTRTTLDRAALEKFLGVNKIKGFEHVTEYVQLNIKESKAS